MRNLGKKMVVVHTYIDGLISKSHTEARVVYLKPDGTYWVNHMGGKRQVSYMRENTYLWEFHIRRVQGANLVGLLGQRSGG